MHADRTISTAEGTLPDRRGTAVSDSGQTWAAWAAHGWRWAVVHGQHLGPEWGFAEAVTNASIFWTMYSGSTGTSGSSSPVRICKGAAEHARHWNGCSCRCAESRTTHLEPILEFIESDCPLAVLVHLGEVTIEVERRVELDLSVVRGDCQPADTPV